MDGRHVEFKYRSAACAAAELGSQPAVLPRVRLWLRAGYFRSTGDDVPDDGRYGTFFQMLPTPRVYARFLFFNLMNLEDAFASLVLRPGARVTIRSDAHRLRLGEPGDLWSVGGGAFEPETFGFAGRPGGARALATLADASVEVRPNPHVTFLLYGGRAFGYVEMEPRR
jgi:hypothetical protein